MLPHLPELPHDAHEALAKAALLEDPFSLQALLTTGTPADAFDPLFDQGLLEESAPNEACFADEAIREEILSSLSWSQRRKLCRALAIACQSLGQEPALVARLFLSAHLLPEARNGFMIAAEQACQHHRYAEAASLMRSAFEIWPNDEEPERRREALRQMVRCASNCNDAVAVRKALNELLAIESEDNLAERIEILRQLAHAEAAGGDPLRSRELLEDAARLAEQGGLTAKAARLWRSLAQAQGDALRLKDASATLKKAQNAAEQVEDWALYCDSLAYAALLTAMLGRIAEANKGIERALGIAIERDLPDQIANAYRRKANVNEYAANYPAYRDTELAALDRCRNLGQVDGAHACLACVSYAFFRLGQYDQSLSAIAEVVDQSDARAEMESVALAVRACIHAFRGVSADVHGDIEAARRLCRIHGAYVFEFYLLWARGVACSMQAQPSNARDAFQELISLWRETDDRKDVVPGLLCAAAFFSLENDRSCLAQCIDILNTIQKDSEAAEPRYAFMAASAEEAWATGDSENAIRRLGEAAAGYSDLQLPFEEAWIYWRLAYVQAQSGYGNDAAVNWKRAESIAKSLSLKPLARAIAQDRRHCSPSEAASLLTPRQIEIAALIAAGRTNKEAASELGLSPRTVEMHVAALIERLGCRTRSEAAAKATELGLVR